LVRDANWVSSRSPKDLPAFNKGMIGLFSENRKGDFGAAARPQPSSERSEYIS
jgi:protease I